MDGSVAEGISSSLQEHPSLPFDPLGYPVLGHASDLEPGSSGHLGNDLGLTLSPGSQQEFQHSGLFNERPFDDAVRQYHNDSTYWTEEEHEPREASVNGELSATSTDQPDCDHESRKRSRDSAFADETDPSAPLKKRLTELPSPLNIPSTKYLSPYSPDSFQQANNEGNAPSTHNGAVSERAESPDSLFEEPTSPNSLFDEPMSPKTSTGMSAAEQHTGSPSTDNRTTEEHTEPRSTSDITRERFALSQEDLEEAKTREIFQGFRQQPQYLSPFPVYGGALGYLPSTPNAHLKCVEVTSDVRLNEEIAFLRRRIQALTRYQRAWEQWTTVDPNTGKTKEQLLSESNAQLKRLLTLQEKKSNDLKKEAEAWKWQAEAWQQRCRDLSIMYNNLLYDFQLRVQAGAGHNLPTAAPHPMGVQAQPTPAANWMPATQPTGIQTGSMPAARSVPPSQPQPQAAVTSALSPVTIDLTSDEGSEVGLARPSSPVDNTAVELRQSFQKKNYDWLGDRNHMRSGYKPQPEYPPYWREVQSRRCSSPSNSRRNSSSSARPGSAGSPPSVLLETDTSNSTPFPAIAEQTENDGDTGCDDDDDDLARMLEEELAGGP
ncbi:hypothetical protein VTN00DRAFT_4439 [Thermoascus crustaceus]|uniref:uncharacterized protein n=1 Tax=Thermoascus crustaceus TaxID=5088 RepID=UPI003742064F